jgi:hypothetical protein
MYNIIGYIINNKENLLYLIKANINLVFNYSN